MKRLIVLGASNLTKSFGKMLAVARERLGAPLELLAAHGHGRSYGATWSTVLARKLPGIIHCGLWRELEVPSDLPTVALVTDIGNDILYEYPVDVIAGWVEACLDRLASANAKVGVVRLPLENLHQLSNARYKFFRNLFMPGCSLSLSQTASRAVELDERVRAMTLARGMIALSQRTEWYGFDPIHLREGQYLHAWREYLSPFADDAKNGHFLRENRIESLYLQGCFPDRVKWFGREFRRAQPSAILRDGTRVSLF